MHRLLRVSIVLFSPGLAFFGQIPPIFAEPNCPAASVSSDTSTCGVRLPFTLHAGYLIAVEGRIGDPQKLKFILDTGVIHSIVDRRIAERLHVPLHPAQVLNFNKTIAVKAATFSYVQFGAVQVRDAPLLVADLPYFSEFTTDIDALIGMDLLRLNNFTIDYEAKEVLFDPIDQAASESASKVDPICLTAEVLLQNRPVRLIVDTGHQGVLLYEERVLKRIPELMLESKTEINIGRRFRAKQMIIPSARLGPDGIDPKIWFVKSPPANVLPGIDGFLGTPSLKAKWIKFNFASNTLSWQ